jgi:hypothetical protein
VKEKGRKGLYLEEDYSPKPMKDTVIFLGPFLPTEKSVDGREFPLPLGSGFTHEVDQAFGWPSGNLRIAVLLFPG